MLELCIDTLAVVGVYHCSENWAIHGDTCYYINDDLYLTWDRARDRCFIMNATMAMVTNERQTEFLAGMS